MKINRRKFLIGASALAAATVTPYAFWQMNKIKTNAHIVVVGGGTAGLSFVNKLNLYADQPNVTLIEPRNFHWYQPGQTLLLAGVYTSATEVIEDIGLHIPDNVTYLMDQVAQYEPDHNRIVTASNNHISYDYLIVATGVELRYDLIEGLDKVEIGRNNIASIYAYPQAGLDTKRQLDDFLKKGEGQAIFTRPKGSMKCAGAPMKVANLAEYFAQQTKQRNHFLFDYFTSENFLFSVPDFNEAIGTIWQQRNVTPHYEHAIVGIDSIANTAYFRLPDDSIELRTYDFIHLVPPMSTNLALRESDLANRDSFSGYLDVDQFSLQHKRYPNVFGIGDVVGTPIGKTAASVKTQVPVVVDNLCALLTNQAVYQQWSGYTSCPMILDVGHAMLWEFDFSLKPTTTLPIKVVDPVKPSTLSWFMEERLIRPVYDLMLKGYTPI